MNKNILVVVFVGELGVVASYFISGGLLAYLFVSLLLFLFFYFIAVNNKDRKENLNIIKDEDRLYFYLSDDLLFKVDISETKGCDDVLKNAFKDNFLGLNGIIERVNFINFSNNSLLLEVNSKISIR